MMNDPVVKMICASPYPGLRPFRTDEERLFFGRQQQYVRMINILKRHNFLAVVGSSGCGKSSLVKAGLLPQLSNPKFSIGDAGCKWIYVVARPGGGPYRNLAVELANQCPVRDVTVDPEQLERRLRTGTDGLIDAIYSVPELAKRHVFVLIDQFEEIFRFGDTSKRRVSELERTKLHDDSLAFVDTLLSTAEARNPQIYVAITMRSDSMGRCDVFQRLPEAVTRSQFLPPRMTKEQLLDAIRCPLERFFNGSIEDAVVSDLLEAMGDRHDQLPVVQHALAQIWKFASERTPPGEHCCITTEDAERCRQQSGSSMGSTIPARLAWVTDAISTHADVVFESLGSPQRQRIARAMFCALCQMDNYEEPERRLTSVKEVAEIVFGDNITDADVQETELVANAFSAETHNFIVRSTTADGKDALDVSHESLLRQWSRLKGWIETESKYALSYRRLIDAVKSGETCLTDTHLEQAQLWLQECQPHAHWAMRYDGAENPESSALTGVLDLIEKSRATRNARLEKEKRAAQVERELKEKTRRILSLLSLALLFLAFAFYGSIQAKMAKDQAKKADDQAKKADDQAKKAEDLRIEAIRQSADQSWRLAMMVRENRSLNSIQSAHFFLRRADLLAQLNSPAELRGSETSALAAAETDANLIRSWIHDRGVSGTLLSRDATRVLTWSQYDGTVRFWGMDRQEPIQTFKPDGADDSLLSDSASSRLIPANDATLLVQDVTAEKPKRADIKDVQLSSDATRVMTLQNDGMARFWDVTKPEPIQTIKLFGDGAQLSRDATRVLTWSLTDGTVWLWDVTNQQSIQTFTHNGLSGAQLSGDATRVLTWSLNDGTLRLWDVTKEEPIRTFEHNGLNGAQLSRDATRALTWSLTDGTVRIWDMTKEEPIRTFEHNGVDGAQLSGDATRVLTWSLADGAAQLWDVTKQELIQQFNHRSLDGARLSGDAAHLLTWSSINGTAAVWDLTKLELIQVLKYGVGQQGGLLSDDGSRLLTLGSIDKTVRLWDATKPAPMQSHELNDVYDALLIGDTLRVLTWSAEERTLRFWEGPKQPIQIQAFKCDKLDGARLSADAKRALSWSHTDGTMQLWDVTKPEPILTFESGKVSGAQFSTDGARVLTWNHEDKTAQLWDVTKQKPIQSFHYDGVYGAQLSGDATRVLTWENDATARLFDVTKPEPIHEFTLLGDEAQLSADGSRVLTWSRVNGLVLLWDVSKLGQILTRQHDGGVNGAQFSSEGTRVVTWSRKAGTVCVWDITDPLARLSPKERLLELEVRSAGTLTVGLDYRNLKFDEWQGKVKSPEYKAILKKLLARNAGMAKPQK